MHVIFLSLKQVNLCILVPVIAYRMEPMSRISPSLTMFLWGTYTESSPWWNYCHSYSVYPDWSLDTNFNYACHCMISIVAWLVFEILSPSSLTERLLVSAVLLVRACTTMVAWSLPTTRMAHLIQPFCTLHTGWRRSSAREEHQLELPNGEYVVLVFI